MRTPAGDRFEAGRARRRRRPITDRVAHYIATETFGGRRLSALASDLRSRRFPLHWSNLFGVVSIACVAVLFLSGAFLMFFYSPSSDPVTYHGAFAPLHDATMSKAYRSTLAISFDVRGGLLVRQLHHWAALLLPASLIVQTLVTFFTGGFRRPRLLGWVLLFLITLISLIGGWSGYALPDDVLSGTGLRIVEGILLGIPVVGTWAASLLFGGEFPGRIIEHLYPVHVVIVPLVLLALIAWRVRAAYVHGPAEFAGPGRSESIVVGVPLFPNATTRALGLMAIVAALLVGASATFTVAPVWLYGPSASGEASAGSQPDWYTGFLDGALRFVPPGWGFVWLGHTWALSILIPLMVVSCFLLGLLLYPFLERWITADSREHNILDRPRNAPTRTAIGVFGITFYAALWGAASADQLATQLSLSIESVLVGYQVLLVLGPIVAFSVTRRICFALQRKDQEILLAGFETGRIVRLPGGGYVEVHQRLDPSERWRVVNPSRDGVIMLQPDARGRLTVGRRLRARLSRFFFEDRLAVEPGALADIREDVTARSLVSS